MSPVFIVAAREHGVLPSSGVRVKRGRHERTRPVDLPPSNRTGWAYVYPEKRLGRHDAGNFLDGIASNGMNYVS